MKLLFTVTTKYGSRLEFYDDGALHYEPLPKHKKPNSANLIETCHRWEAHGKKVKMVAGGAFTKLRDDAHWLMPALVKADAEYQRVVLSRQLYDILEAPGE